MPDIVLDTISMQFGADRAVDGLSLTVHDGAFMCLLGPSGCGKTTTLRMIAGLEEPTGGRISIGDRLLSDATDGTFVPAERRGLGLVFQSYALWPHLTVAQNVEFGLKLRRIDRAARRARVVEVLDVLGIGALAARYPSQLSGGQQQRVALARTLAVNPGVLLMDEPLSNLDARLRLEMRTELLRLHRTFGVTIVFVTHDQWEAMSLASTIAVMRNGTLQQVAPPEEVYDRPANRFVAEFIGSPPINMVDLGSGGSLAAALGPHLPPNAASAGLRPECLLVRAAGTVSPPPSSHVIVHARVDSVLPTGGAWLAELRCGEDKIIVDTRDRVPARPGAPVDLLIDRAAIHAFASDGTSLGLVAPPRRQAGSEPTLITTQPKET